MSRGCEASISMRSARSGELRRSSAIFDIIISISAWIGCDGSDATSSTRIRKDAMIRSKTSSPAQAGIHHGEASAKLSLKYGRLSTMTTSSPRSVASTDSRVRPPFSQASTTREMIGVTGVCRSQSSEVCVMTDATRSSSRDWAIVDPVSMVRREASVGVFG